MGWLSVRDKIFLFTTLSGALFVSCQLQSATLGFHQLSSNSSGAFSTITPPSFQDQRGFFNVLRWAENLHTPQGLELLVRMAQQSTLDGASKATTTSSKDGGRKDNSSSAAAGSNTPPRPSSFHLQLAGIASFEVYVHLSKTLLQCGLLLFLYRLKVLSRRHAMPTICLCILVLLCWKMAQTCLLEILLSSAASSKLQNPATATLSTTDHTLEMKATFLNTLFLLRLAGTTLVNVVVGRSYQHYLCAPWPETWRRVPRYLGSKDLILATLFYASGCVAAMSVSCDALRSLSEAALQFESAALCCALLHFVVFRLSSSHTNKPKQA